MSRPRKKNVFREANGRESRSIIDPAVLATRARHLEEEGISGEHAKDALAGFTLGRLLLRWRADPGNPGGINQEQYDAGDAWASIVRRHGAIMGYRLNIHTPSFVMVGGGRDSTPEPEEETILHVRRQWRECYAAIIKACGTHGMRVRDVTYGVCIENWKIETLTQDDYGHLRTGLNALARALK